MTVKQIIKKYAKQIIKEVNDNDSLLKDGCWIQSGMTPFAEAVVTESLKVVGWERELYKKANVDDEDSEEVKDAILTWVDEEIEAILNK